MTDPTPERESPFSNRVATVAQEILGDEAPDILRERYQHQLEALARHAEFLQTNKPFLFRYSRADSFVHNPNVAPTARVISYALLHTKLFKGWDELQRRYLLDRALGEEILFERSHKDSQEARDRYFSSGESLDWIEYYQNNIMQLEGFQTRLRERATPSTPQRRK